VIVDVEATPARTYDEVAATRTMLDRAEEWFNPKLLAADNAYGTGKFLGWLVFMADRYSIPHVDAKRFHRGERPAGFAVESLAHLNADSAIRKQSF